MGWFKKNPNEVNYHEGKKHFVDIIKNTGSENDLIWLNGEEDFNTNSTLIVAESEEALFFKNGIIEQVFTGGKYQLSTNNYPFISRIRNAFSGGISAFNCKVYFVRTSSSIEILWGTDTPIQLRDPVQMIATSIKARGSYKVSIDDSKKFLLKLVGNNVKAITNNDLTKYFKNEFLQYIKSAIASHILETGQEILGVCAQQDKLANDLTPRIQSSFSDYGIKLNKFSIASIDVPLDDPNRQKLEDAFAQKRLMDVMGKDWDRQQSVDILKTFAENPNQDGIAGLGASLGFGIAAGGVMGNLAQNAFGNIGQQNAGPQPNPIPGSQQGGNKICPACGAVCVAGAKFCGECGEKLQIQKSFCTQCGASLAPGSKFCPDCGAKQQ